MSKDDLVPSVFDPARPHQCGKLFPIEIGPLKGTGRCWLKKGHKSEKCRALLSVWDDGTVTTTFSFINQGDKDPQETASIRDNAKFASARLKAAEEEYLLVNGWTQDAAKNWLDPIPPIPPEPYTHRHAVETQKSRDR